MYTQYRVLMNISTSLETPQLFLIPDDNNDSWEVAANKGDRDKTLLLSHYKLCRLTWKPFGLPNDPRTVEQRIEVTLCAVQKHFYFVFLDNIVVFAKKLWGHWEDAGQ